MKRACRVSGPKLASQVLAGALLYCCTALFAARAVAVPAAAKAKAKASVAQRPPEKLPTRRVPLRVIEVAGGRAYLEPGAARGLREGDQATFAGRAYTIVAVTRSTAAIELGNGELAPGARGSAQVVAGETRELARELPTPSPLHTFAEQWPQPVLPAELQHPTPVPLGVMSESWKNRVGVSVAGYAALPLAGSGSAFASGELRARAHFEPYVALPLAFELDVAVVGYTPELSSRAGSQARPVLRVRELNAAYGTHGSQRAVLGRLRYASAILGQIDGARLETPLAEDFRLSAFGGVSPEPLSDQPSFEAARFGAELVWQKANLPWHPRAVLGGHGSRFDGVFDERRVYALLDLLPELGRLGAHTEVSFYDDGNPWAAAPIELSAAGIDAGLELDFFHLGGRAELRRPDRSRWLASFLPIEWFCRTAGAAGNEGCLGSDPAYWLALDAGARFGKVNLTAGAQRTDTRGADLENVSGFANVRWLNVVGQLRLDAGSSAANGSLVRTVSLYLAPGLGFLAGRADAQLRYRPALVRYRADTSSFLEHGVGAALWFAPSNALDLSLDGELIHGRDVSALILQVLASYRFGK